MNENIANFSRADKILLTMYEMAGGKKNNHKFEDIVVSVFKKFPEDFHLRGYTEFPDSGDLIHKPLYDFRKKGLLEANNKVFSFTDRGISYAEQLAILAKGKSLKSDGRLSRSAEREISRIESSEAFDLFLGGQQNRITDSDFYTYLAVTPRTPRNDFLGRLKNIESAIKELTTQKDLSQSRSAMATYHEFMLKKFTGIIEHFKQTNKK